MKSQHSWGMNVSSFTTCHSTEDAAERLASSGPEPQWRKPHAMNRTKLAERVVKAAEAALAAQH
jgi:hypothetical protein